MAANESTTKTTPLREILAVAGRLVYTLLLAAILVFVPLLAARYGFPWIGAALALASLGVWVKLGPRPFPGLLPGLLSLCGCATIIAVLLLCLVQGTTGFLR